MSPEYERELFLNSTIFGSFYPNFFEAQPFSEDSIENDYVGINHVNPLQFKAGLPMSSKEHPNKMYEGHVCNPGGIIFSVVSCIQIHVLI